MNEKNYFVKFEKCFERISFPKYCIGVKGLVFVQIKFFGLPHEFSKNIKQFSPKLKLKVKGKGQ